ncbi:MAG: DNA repair protein RadA [Bacteroidales bacterium]|nr:DNA repair protein RadA [Bacteroidales bacterium]MBR4453850.1 DNA repair protein RadA [Bacteroidales bacterium]
MAGSKSVYYCQNCGTRSATWLGRCNVCGQWNTFVEEVIQRSPSKKRENVVVDSQPQLLKDITGDTSVRISSGIGELDRVLGGGIVQGSIILLGGDPGIGKSTLMLQLALNIKNTKVLYVSGEESATQIKLRASRMQLDSDNCYIVNETSLQAIFSHIDSIKPNILIIDSIQTLQTDTLDSSAGSISQIRETASELQRYAKQTATTIFLIGHITKDGVLAGPKVLEHIVDVVLQFEGDNKFVYRLIRATKNRFGSVSEIGIFEMMQNGLREVDNPSEILISHRDEDISGVAVATTIEGNRPLLIEVQALVASAIYGNPQRSATGFDFRRLSMLLAVLDKKCGKKFSSHDVFLNIAGGIKTDDTAVDLSIVAALLSSAVDIPISSKDCFAGELSLSGEVRPVSRIDTRISEAMKLGYKRIFISASSKVQTHYDHIEVKKISKVSELIKYLFS